jgi:hypothetical protein
MKLFNGVFAKHFSAFVALIVLMAVGLACSNKSDAEWKKELGGKKLSSAKTSGSLSDKTNIWFCPSGEYLMQKQFSGYSTGGGGTLSMADEDTEYGTWRVDSGVLILEPQQGGSGEVSRYDLSQGMDSNVVELGGRGYLVESHNECR